jgi:hypothetical protein
VGEEDRGDDGKGANTVRPAPGIGAHASIEAKSTAPGDETRAAKAGPRPGVLKPALWEASALRGAVSGVSGMPDMHAGQRVADGLGMPASEEGVAAPLAHEAKLVLYERALHPALLHVHARRFLSVRLRGRTWDAELWMLEGGHAAVFGHRGTHSTPAWWASEMVSPAGQAVPLGGVARAIAIPHERDLEVRFGLDGVTYLCSMQCERLSPAAYANELDEQLQSGREDGSLVHAFTSVAGAGLSVVDMRRGETEVAITAFHLLPLGGGYGVSVRTQGMFEVG